MKITNQHVAENFKSTIAKLNQEQVKLQKEVSSGQRITKPSDDGTKFARVMKSESSKRDLIQYRRNAEHAEDIIKATHLALDNIKELNLRAEEIAAIASSGTNKGAYSAYTEEVDQLLQEILNIGNSTFQDKFLFSGQAVTTKSFAKPTAVGSGATATGAMSAAGVISATVGNVGSGYRYAPEVTIISGDGKGSGATATATISGSISASNQFEMLDKGSGYSTTAGDVTFELKDAAGNTGSGTATVDANGQITGLTMTAAATFTSLPKITITDSTGAGSGAAVYIDYQATVTGITVDNQGSGYTASIAPTILISDENRIPPDVALTTAAGYDQQLEFFVGEDSKIDPYLNMKENSFIQNIANHLAKLRDVLGEDGDDVPNKAQAILTNLIDEEDNIVQAIADQSAKLLRVETVQELDAQEFLNLEEQVSRDVDIDLSEWMIKLTQANMAYQVALQSGSALFQNSLLDYV